MQSFTSNKPSIVGTLLCNSDSNHASSKSKKSSHFIPIWNQEVTDEQGRKRLHGAFKGGFSAGYFNSVGSKEGWQPSSFESSRSNRNQLQQRPEDYMDEEDIEDALDGKELRPTSHPLDTCVDDPLQLNVQADHASNKYQLLKRLGYPPHLISNKYVIPQSNTNYHGLGYSPVSHDSPRSKIVNRTLTRSRKIMRGRIGVGILNEDEDDIDVYSDGDSGQPLLPVIQKINPKPNRHVGIDASDTPVSPTSNILSQFICHARGVTLNVTKSSKLDVIENWTSIPPTFHLPTHPQLPIPFPPLPPNFPHSFLKDLESIRGSNNLLFDPNLVPMSGLNNLPFKPDTAHPPLPIPPNPFETSIQDALIPKLISKDIAKSVLNALNKPFSGAKRARFLAYCLYCADDNGSNSPPPISAPEQAEFVSTAQLFRPMAQMLEDRFTRGQVQVGDKEVESAVSNVEEVVPVKKTAAHMGMFGKLTRTVTGYRPHPIVCKRFKVPVPEVDEDLVMTDGSVKKSRVGGVDKHLNEATIQMIVDGAVGSNPMSLNPVQKNGPSINELKEIDNVAGGGEESPIPRPPQEVFDKIFGDAVEELAKLHIQTQWSQLTTVDAEEMPVFVNDGAVTDDVDQETAVRLVLQNEEDGTDINLGKLGSGNEEYVTIDQRDLAVNVAAGMQTFRPQLFKRKASCSNDHGDRMSAVKPTEFENNKKKKSKKTESVVKKKNSVTTCLSFGDEV